MDACFFTDRYNNAPLILDVKDTYPRSTICHACVFYHEVAQNTIDATPEIERRRHFSSGMAAVENELDMGIFRKRCLNTSEEEIFKMLLENRSVIEILHEVHVIRRQLLFALYFGTILAFVYSPNCVK